MFRLNLGERKPLPRAYMDAVGQGRGPRQGVSTRKGRQTEPRNFWPLFWGNGGPKSWLSEATTWASAAISAFCLSCCPVCSPTHVLVLYHRNAVDQHSGQICIQKCETKGRYLRMERRGRREEFRKSKRCSWDTYPESYITKYSVVYKNKSGTNLCSRVSGVRKLSV